MHWQPGGPETTWEKHLSDPYLEQNVTEDFLICFLSLSFLHTWTDRGAYTEVEERIRFSSDVVKFCFPPNLKAESGIALHVAMTTFQFQQ
jgi:hypothetical protein